MNAIKELYLSIVLISCSHIHLIRLVFDTNNIMEKYF